MSLATTIRCQRCLYNLQRDDLLTEIELSPLDTAQVTELAQLIGGAELADEQAAQLYADTEGNPLFVVEMVRADQKNAPLGNETQPNMDRQAADSAQTLFLPPKVHAVIQSRLTQLSEPTQELVSLAAVIGRSFSYDLLVAVSKRDEDTVVDCLDELWARQIIREQGVDRYDFSHDRIRDVAYGEVSRTRRRLLHRRVAETLEALQKDALDEVCGLLAEHYEQAGNSVSAIEYHIRAGDRAREQFALDDALRYYERVLTLLPSHEYVRRYETLDKRLSIFKQLHYGERHGAEIAVIGELIDSHLAVLPNPLEVQARFALHQARYTHSQGDYAAAASHAKEAERWAQEARLPEVEAEAVIAWGGALWSQGDLTQAGSKLRAGAEKAKRAGRADLQAKGLEFCVQTGMFAGMSMAEMVGLLQQCLAIHKDNQDIVGQCHIYNKLGYIQVAEGDGDYAKAKQYYCTGIRLAKQFSGLWIEMNLIRNLGFLYVCEGNHRDAIATINDALTRSKRHEVRIHELYSRMALGYECFNRGDFAGAESHYKQGLGIAEVLKVAQFWARILSKLGLLFHYQGRSDEAIATLHQAIDMAQKLGDLRVEGQALSRLGHTLKGLTRFDEAASVYQQALANHRQMNQINRSMEPLAGLVQIAMQEGNRGDARTMLAEILARLATQPMERTEEGLRVYRTCYQFLQAEGDPQANHILQIMYDQLQARAATIDDPEQQRMFWEDMPGHREIAEAIKAQK